METIDWSKVSKNSQQFVADDTDEEGMFHISGVMPGRCTVMPSVGPGTNDAFSKTEVFAHAGDASSTALPRDAVPDSALELYRHLSNLLDHGRVCNRFRRAYMDWIPQRRWRELAAPIGPSEVRRTERVLARVRASLAAAGFIAVLMSPIQSLWVYCLLLTYVIHSFSVMVALKLNKRSSSPFRVLIYGVDLMWPALIYAFPMERNLFSLFFVFVLAAAALRWGLWETIGTAAGSLTLLWLESVVLRHGLVAALGGFLARYHWPELGIDLRELEPKKLIILSFCLLLMGWLLGYLAEHHKFLRAELERASIARELHDTVLQSLLGLNMRLHVLSESLEGSAAQEVRQIRDITVEEARTVREFEQRVKPLDVDAKTLCPHLIERTQRFERETGIRARFVSDSSVVDVERSTCDLVVRIVHEALRNVRKYSCATDVWVRLDRKDSHWQLTIEDNGIGFPYSGRFSQSELKASGKGPLVIIDCVTSIGGDLTLESTAGRGSRLEITIRGKWRAAHGRRTVPNETLVN